jgi:hypothetical protein
VACGGGVAIAVGFAPLSKCVFGGSIMLGGSVALTGMTASGNSIFCLGCFHGTVKVPSFAHVKSFSGSCGTCCTGFEPSILGSGGGGIYVGIVSNTALLGGVVNAVDVVANNNSARGV